MTVEPIETLTEPDFQAYLTLKSLFFSWLIIQEVGSLLARAYNFLYFKREVQSPALQSAIAQILKAFQNLLLKIYIGILTRENASTKTQATPENLREH